MSGDWPPEWDDPEEDFPSGAEQQDATGSAEMGEARLAEVTAYLVSVPAPVMPDAVAARISAALAAEAAARAANSTPAADGTQAGDGTRAANGTRAGDGTQAEAAAAEGGTGAGATADGGRTLGTPPARARVRRHGGGARGHHGFRSIPVKAVTSVMAGLVVIAGIGYGISRTNGSTDSSSSAASGSASENTFAAAAPEASSASSASASSAAGAGSHGISPQFVVTASGTKYQAATLASQVRARLSHPPVASSPVASNGGPSSVPGPSGTSSVPAAGASKTAAVGVAHAPTTALRACVLHLTGGQPPRFVDRATYQGDPAYVIVTSNHVWVVGLGCTTANEELITSVALGS
jgi:hypothetical protein